MTWTEERTDEIGRVVLATGLPDGYGLFYTTIDFSGRLAGEDARSLMRFIDRRWGEGIGLATCTQVHGTDIAFATNPSTGWRELGKCDALWSDRPNVAIGIKVADCLPVSIIDAKHRVAANLHSGWRGAAGLIVPRALDELSSHSGFDAASAHVWLGPSIRQCCFEVGEEVVEAFEKGYGSVDDLVDRSRGERPYFDLVKLTRRALAARGVPPEAVHDSGFCTRCDGSMFHSYRRDSAASGRVLAVVVQARISDQSAI